MNGETLYALYLQAFGTIFAPQWTDLDDLSKRQWNDLAATINRRLA
jgi:hypothetical protein